MSLDAALQEKLEDFDMLVLPGWQNSGPRHWQSLWEDRFPGWQRVQQQDWLHPRRDDWVAALEDAVAACHRPVLLVAHSLGCIATALWAARHDASRVAAALLVAPADVERSTVAASLRGFAPIPVTPLPFPALLVGSDNDPACSARRAATLAHAWRADFRLLPGAGHINAESGLGDWDAGLGLLDAWLGRRIAPAVRAPQRFRRVA